MDLRLLEQFVSVAEESSIRSGARRLMIVQPAVSKGAAAARTSCHRARPRNPLPPPSRRLPRISPARSTWTRSSAATAPPNWSSAWSASPRARTNWHSHANGQLLRCTDGMGLVATRDGTAIRMRAGDTVWTPAGEEHWHGGGPNSMMCHYAILDAAGDGEATTWLEPVTDAQYTAADANA